MVQLFYNKDVQVKHAIGKKKVMARMVSSLAPLNVVTILRDRLFNTPSVGVAYVDKLFHMVQRRLKREYRFYCLTNSKASFVPGVRVLPLPEMKHVPANKAHDWHKLSIFSKDMPFTGHVLFLDLNVILLDAIDCFFTYKGQFRLNEMPSKQRHNMGNLSIFSFDTTDFHHVWSQYIQNPPEILANHDHARSFLLNTIGPGRLHYWPPNWCKSFHKHCVSKWWRFGQSPFPYATKMLLFEDKLQPHHAIQGIWPGAFPPRMRPVRWLEDYWGEAPVINPHRRLAS